MAPISESIEINRRPEEVFAYLDDVKRHGEWQEQIVAVKPRDDGPLRVGSRVKETRRVPGGDKRCQQRSERRRLPQKTKVRMGQT